MNIAPASEHSAAHWLQLRGQLWPHCPLPRHQEDIAAQLAKPSRHIAFLAHDAAGQPIGLIEAALRHDYVNGTSRSPVAFLEGIYVVPAERRRGVARLLLARVKAWARQHGCDELASDAQLDNHPAQAAHLALGFAESERVVFYKMAL
ncbi:aminoglycoside 6'-N-acetyltransferase [Chromobacterium sphagni]|uniref:Aminoglycoside N(6')-acetyltransferase type 1 n=1 Tax=Chromobacterium sphagni TaxID=1903179 RepID=A0A1S1WY59_9NEIS|nr:aminoglycoside 6'-N-acetyltransferase [Chromobacterium sphagni]OHX12202.1 aminoglycoside 6'-acetyltransferase [Chromobacterium sphagni]OHX21714.1 aminoglycoside 6'-acetyltransferase [Chromobacterium sphagni]